MSHRGYAARIEFDGEEHGNKRWRARLENGKGSRQLLAACVEAGAPLSLFEPANLTGCNALNPRSDIRRD